VKDIFPGDMKIPTFPNCSWPSGFTKLNRKLYFGTSTGRDLSTKGLPVDKQLMGQEMHGMQLIKAEVSLGGDWLTQRLLNWMGSYFSVPMIL